ncbi:MAG: hypothetical protein DHS20C17_15490 [Cyclobacteriaceae bacterium]|nr:MAG: hypothetical protein DHS20C17_15490 [Cyclobacteriaceae bacterium]
MPKRHSWFFVICIFFTSNILAQNQEARCRWISAFDQPVILDSLSVDISSIHFPGDSSVSFQYSYSDGTIIVSPAEADSVKVCFRVFPFAFHHTYSHRSIQQYDSTAFFKIAPAKNEWPDHREELFATSELYKSGSISRGISFGNNQDVFVNSNLNLQMEGKLTSDVNIRAVITDQNIPFQPDGNTQQLQDFDKVLIELFNDKFHLNAGDVVLKHQGKSKGESYFLQYYKNVQGGQLSTNYSLLKGKAQSNLGVSIAKGKFASIQIDPLEGVQGPYRVHGPNNERFVVVLAGSEKVFVDGEQLTRGYNNHYTIDYNLGEIIFTNSVLITKYTRIRVDFEFSDQNYSKSIIEASQRQRWGKTQVFVNAYSEKDNKNRPLSFNLTNSDKESLSHIGDDLNQAVISSIDSVGYSENRILYSLVDTLDAVGNRQQVLVYSTNPDSAIYQAQFTQVGASRGSYVQSASNLNGRVFEWVGVNSNGEFLGDYQSQVLATTPQKKQMVTIGLVHDISSVDYVYAEAAFSTKDLNLYSEIDDYDNQGKAFKTGFVRTNQPIAGGKYLLSGKVEYEFNSQYFTAIDRFRYIEFERDWSLTSEDLSISEQDHIFNAEIELAKDPDNFIKYRLVRRKRGQMVDGYQQDISLAKSVGNFQLKSDLYKMSSDKLDTHSDWLRWTLDAYYRTNWLIPGYRYQVDRNQINTISSDSIVGSAMNYSAHSFYLRNSDSVKTRFLLDYTVREDRQPVSGDIVPENLSHTARFGLGTEIGNNQRLDMLFTYRNLENLQFTDGPINEESITGRLDWQGTFLDRHLISELNYQVGNGRELKREFIFIEVPTGEGTHTWRDENQDGVQDLNEFYIALNPDERNFAKIFVPTDDYVLAFSNTLNYRLNLEMPRNWRHHHGIKRLLSRVSSQTSLNIQRKLTDDNLSKRFSPFAKNIEDDDLISSKEQFRTTWFYNRSHAKYGFDFGRLSIRDKQLLVDGFEARNITENHMNVRYSPRKSILLRLYSRQKTKKISSDFLDSRNYIIREDLVSPEMAWQPSNQFRLTGKYSIAERKNILFEGNGESASVKEFSVDLRHAKAQRSSIDTNITFTNIKYTGEVNTAVGYELLQALQPGNNVLWSAQWQFKIAAGLQLQVSYNGRKSTGANTIHTGRMQVNALF